MVVSVRKPQRRPVPVSSGLLIWGGGGGGIGVLFCEFEDIVGFGRSFEGVV